MEKIIKNKKYILIFILILFFIVTATIYYYFSYKNNKIEEKKENEVIEEKIIEEENVVSEVVEEVPIIKEYIIDVKGAVNNPGVYKLNENSIVNDAINIAGGLNKYADTKCINLSKKIIDEMVIYVYTKNETWQILNKENEKPKENNIICNEIKNDAYIEENKNKDTKTEKITESSTTETTNTLININNDGIEKLTTLPGIGESKAKTIIEYRKSNGNFKTIEELKNVSGIGDSTFEKIKDLITI